MFSWRSQVQLHAGVVGQEWNTGRGNHASKVAVINPFSTAALFLRTWNGSVAPDGNFREDFSEYFVENVAARGTSIRRATNRSRNLGITACRFLEKDDL